MDASSNRHDVPVARPITRAPMVELVDEAPTELGFALHPKPSLAAHLVVSQPRIKVVFDLFVACAVFFGVLLTLGSVTAVESPSGEVTPARNAWVLLAVRGSVSIATAVVLWVIVRSNGQSLASIGLHRRGLATVPLWGFLAYLTVTFFVLGLGLLFSRYWPSAFEAMQQGQEHNMERLPPMGVPMALLFSLTVAIGEELLFRGFIVTRLRCLTHSWTASVLVSSVFFAVFHLGQGYVPTLMIFGLGVLLGFWLILRGSVLVVILAHMLFDATSLMFMNQALR